MALTIEGATVGYDNEGVNKLSQDIKAEQIDAAISHMKGNLETWTSTVDEVWRGHSADIFKQNVQTDVEKITSALEKTHEALDAELKQIVKAMGNVDQELVKSR